MMKFSHIFRVTFVTDKSQATSLFPAFFLDLSLSRPHLSLLVLLFGVCCAYLRGSLHTQHCIRLTEPTAARSNAKKGKNTASNKARASSTAKKTATRRKGVPCNTAVEDRADNASALLSEDSHCLVPPSVGEDDATLLMQEKFFPIPGWYMDVGNLQQSYRRKQSHSVLWEMFLPGLGERMAESLMPAYTK